MHWFDRLGIDRTCRLVGLHAGMLALTVEPDGTHAIWMLGERILAGDAQTMRNAFADRMGDHWLAFIYRS